MTYFIFDGERSDDYGLHILSSGKHDAPSRNYETVQVLGKNGDLLIDKRRFENVEMKYTCSLDGDLTHKMRDIRSWLLGVKGYAMLKDSFNTDEYYMARVTSNINVSDTRNRSGHFDLTFSRKPERYLIVGGVMYFYTANTQLENPTNMDAYPVIRVYGKGAVRVGSAVITVLKAGTNYIDIDTSIMDAYEGSANRNSYISISGEPVLTGDATTGITLGTGITKVGIKPNWWRL